MRKVIAYIAMSVDGYIADSKGDVSWLEGDQSNQESDYDGYNRFLETIDTVVMGNTTYQQGVNELSLEQ